MSQPHKSLPIFNKINDTQLLIVHIRSMSGCSKFRIKILQEKKMYLIWVSRMYFIIFHMIMTKN